MPILERALQSDVMIIQFSDAQNQTLYKSRVELRNPLDIFSHITNICGERRQWMMNKFDDLERSLKCYIKMFSQKKQ